MKSYRGIGTGTGMGHHKGKAHTDILKDAPGLRRGAGTAKSTHKIIHTMKHKGSY